MRKNLIIVVACLFPSLALASTAVEFDAYFTGKTWRVDLHHTGDAEHEMFSIEKIRVEGDWSGSKRQLLDDAAYGKYFLEVVDATNQLPLYSRGFASIWGEWQSTGDARRRSFTLPEAVRIPEPKAPVQLRIRVRGDDGLFNEVFAGKLDPAARAIDRSPLMKLPSHKINDGGDPASAVDVVILGDGYAPDEIDRYHERARELTEALFATEPYKSRQQDFNVWLVDSPSVQSGVSRPRAGVHKDTALGASYNSFDSERYLLIMDDRGWREVAAVVPYDYVIVLVNERKYGGGGIYNLYATVAAESSYADYLMIHEFGHSFAGLGDEYFTSPTAYEEFVKPDTEPWEPNITALLDSENLKWGDLVEDGTELPTAWDKEGYETESRAMQAVRAELRAAHAAEEELEALFDDEKVKMTARLSGEENFGVIGAFEGAGYQSRGLYRPAVDCIMFTRDDVGFCDVCSNAIERVIDLYSR